MLGVELTVSTGAKLGVSEENTFGVWKGEVSGGKSVTGLLLGLVEFGDMNSGVGGEGSGLLESRSGALRELDLPELLGDGVILSLSWEVGERNSGAGGEGKTSLESTSVDGEQLSGIGRDSHSIWPRQQCRVCPKE